MDDTETPDQAQVPIGAPMVSVVIPTYNRAATLPAAIESALAQSYGSVEVVVVDDGSTDDTPAVLERFAGRIAAVRQDNRGASGARNTGVRAARGEILVFLDSDDLLRPNAVARHLAVLSDAGSAIPCSMGDLEMQRADGTVESMFSVRRLRPKAGRGLWTNVHDVLTTRFLFTNQTLAVRRDAFDAVGGYDESLWVMEDFDLAMRLGAVGPWGYTIDTVAVWHEGTPDSLTRMAHRDRDRLDETVLDICAKLHNAGIPESAVARRALRFTARKAQRSLRLRQPQPWQRSAVARTQRGLEETVGERVFRRSPVFPPIKGPPP